MSGFFNRDILLTFESDFKVGTLIIWRRTLFEVFQHFIRMMRYRNFFFGQAVMDVLDLSQPAIPLSSQTNYRNIIQ